MPAYMAKKLIPVCRGLGCDKQATWSVVNTRNELVGEYCRKHAEELLRKLERKT